MSWNQTRGKTGRLEEMSDLSVCGMSFFTDNGRLSSWWLGGILLERRFDYENLHEGDEKSSTSRVIVRGNPVAENVIRESKAAFSPTERRWFFDNTQTSFGNHTTRLTVYSKILDGAKGLKTCSF